MKNKTKAILGTISVLAVFGVSGILAYLTDNDSATNKFVVGKVKIELEEPKWDKAEDTNNNNIPDYAENISPNARIQKDPQVTNTGKNSAYVYLKVTVPVKYVISAEQDGTITNNGQQATQLFSYTPSSKWTQIESKKQENKKTNERNEEIIDSYTYFYYYNEKLEPGVTTEPLFETVVFANVIEGQIDLADLQIDIDAYAIQSDNLPENTNIEEAFNIYLNQNKQEESI